MGVTRAQVHWSPHRFPAAHLHSADAVCGETPSPCSAGATPYATPFPGVTPTSGMTFPHLLRRGSTLAPNRSHPGSVLRVPGGKTASWGGPAFSGPMAPPLAIPGQGYPGADMPVTPDAPLMLPMWQAAHAQAGASTPPGMVRRTHRQLQGPLPQQSYIATQHSSVAVLEACKWEPQDGQALRLSNHGCGCRTSQHTLPGRTRRCCVPSP